MWVRVPVDVASTIIVGGLVGVLEVTLAHALIAESRRRREALAGALEAGAAGGAAGRRERGWRRRARGERGRGAPAAADQAAER